MSTRHKRFVNEVALGAVTSVSGNAFRILITRCQ